MLNREPTSVPADTFDDWELIFHEEGPDFEAPEKINVLQRMTAALQAIIDYALSMLGKSAVVPADFTLLQQGRLYDLENERFSHILEKAHSLLRTEPDGNVPLDRLSRLLNGDSYGLSAPLSHEVRQCIQNLADIRIMADMDDSTYIEVQRQLPEFILNQGRDFRPLSLESGAHGKIRCRFSPEISAFLLKNEVDDFTQDALEDMLGTLAQLALELTCTRDNQFQDWLNSPATFNLNRFFPSPGARKEAMPAVLNAILQVVTPLAFLQHAEHFSKLMQIVILFVQFGILPAREYLLRLYTGPHDIHGSDRPAPRSLK